MSAIENDRCIDMSHRNKDYENVRSLTILCSDITGFASLCD